MTIVTVSTISQPAAASTTMSDLVESLAHRILSELYGSDAGVYSLEDHVAHQRRRSYAAHPSNFIEPDLAW